MNNNYEQILLIDKLLKVAKFQHTKNKLIEKRNLLSSTGTCLSIQSNNQPSIEE